MDSNKYKVQFLTEIKAGYESHFWYGGPVVEIVYENYIFSIQSIGDVRAHYVAADGEESHFVDKNNGGIFMYEFAQIIEGDDGLKQLVENEGKKNKPYIEFSNNNWWECLLLKDNGGYIDLQWVLNSYNIYDAIEEVLESIEEIIKKEEEVL